MLDKKIGNSLKQFYCNFHIYSHSRVLWPCESFDQTAWQTSSWVIFILDLMWYWSITCCSWFWVPPTSKIISSSNANCVLLHLKVQILKWLARNSWKKEYFYRLMIEQPIYIYLAQNVGPHAWGYSKTRRKTWEWLKSHTCNACRNSFQCRDKLHQAIVMLFKGLKLAW